ncbi:hypothetical protein GEMRC1_007602 [Eukaryota sp. GEM-RC1]
MKQLGKYVVLRQDEDLWAQVLHSENSCREKLVDTIVGTVIPACQSQDEVSVTVRSFMTAGLQIELIQLLEKIVLQPSPFSNISSLQNLMILTAIKVDHSRVLDYVTRLNNYDHNEIAGIAIKMGMNDEAFVIYRTNDEPVKAITVLLDYDNSLDKAVEFANRIQDPLVYSKLGMYQLQQENNVEDAISSLIKASDYSCHEDVIEASMKQQSFTALISYLKMCRKHTKTVSIDSSLAICYAHTDAFVELEDLLNSQSCVANWVEVGDSLLNAQLFESAKIVFTMISQYGKLASTLLALGEYKAAVDAARKANSYATWKEVCKQCVENQQFKLAQIAGINVVSHPEETDPLVQFYEEQSAHDEIIALLETASGLDKAHVGLFTALGELYAKHRPQKLMEHISLYASRVNTLRLLHACKNENLWTEVVELYQYDQEYEHACEVMMNHASAFDHSKFRDLLSKSANVELYYRSVAFYLANNIEQLSDLLCALPRIDKARLVTQVQDEECLSYIKDWLLYVQDQDDRAVNDALNDIFIKEEDFESLKTSIDNYHNMDLISLAATLGKSEDKNFRQIAAYVLRKLGRFEKSIELYKQDEFYDECVSTAAASENKSLCESMLSYFVEVDQEEYLQATLKSCFEFISPDVVLELAWNHGLSDCCMPYFILVTRSMSKKIEELTQFKNEMESKNEPTPTDFNPQFGFGFE